MNNLNYFVITETVYKAAIPAPLKNNYPMYKLDEEGNPILDEEGNPILKSSWTWKQVNEANPRTMVCFPKQMDYGDGEVTMWVGKENKELLWDEADIVAINGKTGCFVFNHEEVTEHLNEFLIAPFHG